MKFWSLILLLGVCFPHWTTSSPVRAGDYLLDIDEETLNDVTIVVHSSHLDLSGQRIKHIALNAFDNVAHIKTLDLSTNQLRALPPLIFSKLINLEELTLAHNEISDFDRTFIGLNNLKVLNLSNNRISSLNLSSLIGLRKSTEIIIDGNRLQQFSINIPRDSSHPEDELLDIPSIDDDDEEPIPENLRVKLCKTDDGTVESLEELSQSETLGDCMEVDVYDQGGIIELNNLGLKKFQRGWYKLSADFIRTIDLSRNEIVDITPELLNDLPSPLFVDLSDNRIRQIKKNIIETKQCLSLNLEGNSPLAIEDGAFEKMCLTQLGVDQTGLNNLNFIRTLPVTIEVLKLTGNGISEIPSNTFQGLTNLREIRLSFNNLENIELGTFEDQKKLSVIDLRSNKISQLNFKLFTDSSVLHKIHLGFNKINKIYKNTFLGLRHLHRFDLDLSNNEIDSIEEGSFSHLDISSLDLSSNKITDESIVNGAFNLCTLEHLKLNYNSITILNGDTFSGISDSYDLNLYDTPIKTIKNFLN